MKQTANIGACMVCLLFNPLENNRRPHLCGHADEEQLIQQSYEATGQMNNSYCSLGGAGAWRGTINLQHDEPGSEGIDPAWPEKVGPETCLDYLHPLLSSLKPHLPLADCTSPKASASQSCIPKILQKKKKKKCSSHLEKVLLTVSKWEQAVGGESGVGGGTSQGFLLSLSCH